MTDSAGDAASLSAIVRVDIDHGGEVSTHWVHRGGFVRPGIAHLYDHAGELLEALQALAAVDSPTEGSLIDRVERHARTVAAHPELEAAIGFFDGEGQDGLVRITSAQTP